MKRVYISGKITGLEHIEAFKNFQDAEHHLMMNFDDLEIVSPMREVPYQKDKTWDQYMIDDIKLLFDCDSICMLPDWKESKGARIEHCIAIEMSKEIIYLK